MQTNLQVRLSNNLKSDIDMLAQITNMPKGQVVQNLIARAITDDLVTASPSQEKTQTTYRVSKNTAENLKLYAENKQRSLFSTAELCLQEALKALIETLPEEERPMFSSGNQENV